MNVKIFGKSVSNIMPFSAVLLFNDHIVLDINYYQVVHRFDITVEHKKKLLNMLVKIILKIEPFLGMKSNIRKDKQGFFKILSLIF